jgi:hypothetical protein
MQNFVWSTEKETTSNMQNTRGKEEFIVRFKFLISVLKSICFFLKCKAVCLCPANFPGGGGVSIIFMIIKSSK